MPRASACGGGSFSLGRFVENDEPRVGSQSVRHDVLSGCPLLSFRHTTMNHSLYIITALVYASLLLTQHSSLRQVKVCAV